MNTRHFFVDEAGDLTLFDRKGRPIVGTPGVSQYFIVGVADLPDPENAHQQLLKLRTELLADPYFKGVPSMQPDNKKTAIAFHAKDDLPEVCVGKSSAYSLLSKQKFKLLCGVKWF